MQIAGNGQLHGVAYGTQSLIPSGATSYNSTVTLTATATGTNYGYPPLPPVTVTSSPVQITVQVGYILGAPALTTAAVTAPKDGSTFILNGGGAQFAITSDHRWDFFRYDTFGAYTPVVNNQLETSYPAPAGLKIIGTQSVGFQLLPQIGDLATTLTLSCLSPNEGVPAHGTHLPFVNKATSFYPPSTSVASRTSSATATFP